METSCFSREPELVLGSVTVVLWLEMGKLFCDLNNCPSSGLLEGRQMLSCLPLDFWRKFEVPKPELDPDTKPGLLHVMILFMKDSHLQRYQEAGTSCVPLCALPMVLGCRDTIGPSGNS